MQISMPYNKKNKNQATDSIRGIYPSPYSNRKSIQNEVALSSFSSAQSNIKVMLTSKHISWTLQQIDSNFWFKNLHNFHKSISREIFKIVFAKALAYMIMRRRNKCTNSWYLIRWTIWMRKVTIVLQNPQYKSIYRIKKNLGRSKIL